MGLREKILDEKIRQKEQEIQELGTWFIGYMKRARRYNAGVTKRKGKSKKAKVKMASNESLNFEEVWRAAVLRRLKERFNEDVEWFCKCQCATRIISESGKCLLCKSVDQLKAGKSVEELIKFYF